MITKKELKNRIEELECLADLNCFEFNDFVQWCDKQYWQQYRSTESMYIEYINKENQTPEMCIEAIKQNALSLKNVKINQTLEICLIAIEQNYLVSTYITQQTPEILIKIIEQNYRYLKHIFKQTPIMCMEAIKQNGWALRYVIDQTPKYVWKLLNKMDILLNM